jgi:mannose-1-phosphate guanylyltransferase
MIVVTTQALEKSVLSLIPNVTVLSEPRGRNTAPCIYWAARHVAAKNPEGVMLVMPADHSIAQPERFLEVVKTAADWAASHEDLVTLGILPSRPETGYGYLKTCAHPESHTMKSVEAFVEKPTLLKAEEFLKSGNYLWNGGMFLWKAKTILAAFDRYMPEMRQAWEESAGRVEDAYPKMTATSIDYGIMEKAKNVVAFPLDCGWDDLGSWTSLDDMADALNVRQGKNVVTSGDLVALESSHNIVDAPNRLIALLGVNDLIIVEKGEALLVAHKDRAQDIRQLVDEVKKKRPDLI